MNLLSFTNQTPAASHGSARLRRWAGAGLLVGAALAASAAQAADVYWNIGMQMPGAVVEVANAPRVVYGYGAPPMMMVPAPVYGAAWVPAYPERRWHRRHHHRHDGDRGWDDGRYERHERYEGDRRHWR